MKIITPIFNSMKRSLRGREKLWVVFWLWGVALYVGSIAVGFVVVMDWNLAASWFGTLVAFLGYVLVFIYPFIFCYSLIVCSKNTNKIWSKWVARAYALIFIPAIHWWVGLFILMGNLSILSKP